MFNHARERIDRTAPGITDKQNRPHWAKVAKLLPLAMTKGTKSQEEMTPAEEDRRRRVTYGLEVRED